MGKEEDDAIYIIIFNKRPKAVNAQKKKKKNRPHSAAVFVGDDRLVAVLFLETNEGKREKAKHMHASLSLSLCLCLSLSLSLSLFLSPSLYSSMTTACFLFPNPRVYLWLAS